MNRAKSSEHRPPPKSDAVPKDVNEYLTGVPEPARSTLNKVREMILSAAPPEATEGISYRIPVVKYKGRPLVWYAAFKDHCSLYPINPSIREAFKNELKGSSTSKGTLRYPLNKPPSTALVKQLVKSRITENEQKKQH